MREAFIETDGVGRFGRAVDALLAAGRGTTGFMLAFGQAGRGKTFAAEHHYARLGGVYLRVWQDWTQAAMLQRLLFEAQARNGDMPRSSANRCKTQIVELLGQSRKAVFVDEADRLSIGRINDLRDIHIETGAPIVLIGELELLGLLSEQRRIWSRVAHEVEFGPIQPDEVAVYAMRSADLDIPPEVCSTMVNRAEGDFRLIRNMLLLLEQAARAKETSEVDAAMLDDVLASRSWRRS